LTAYEDVMLSLLITSSMHAMHAATSPEKFPVFSILKIKLRFPFHYASTCNVYKAKYEGSGRKL